MARIKIDDLTKDMKTSKAEMMSVHGGGSTSEDQDSHAAYEWPFLTE